MASLNFFDCAQSNNLQVGLAILQFSLKEEDCTHRWLLGIVHLHFMVEDKLIVRHANETLAVAEGCKYLAWALDYDLLRRRLTLQELLPEVADVEMLQIFLLNKGQRL